LRVHFISLSSLTSNSRGPESYNFFLFKAEFGEPFASLLAGFSAAEPPSCSAGATP
jgi:hypothetical protein